MRGVRRDPALYAWFLHRQLLETLLRSEALTPRARISRSARLRHGDHNAHADELERWLRTHEVPSLASVLNKGRCTRGAFVWAETDFCWSDVAAERRAAHADPDADIRSSFHGTLDVRGGTTSVHGTFNPKRLTCSTANVELAGIRNQYILGYITNCTEGAVEIRPLTIATRLLAPCERRWDDDRWQHVHPAEIDHFAGIHWHDPLTPADLEALRHIPEAQVKQAIAAIVREPVVPKDWGGETCDLWTPRLLVNGKATTAAWLLKGPSRFAPMTIGMLGSTGDQIERLARTSAQLLIVQHCHEIRPEVHTMLRSVASDFRDVRRYMLIDGYDTLRILKAFRFA